MRPELFICAHFPRVHSDRLLAAALMRGHSARVANTGHFGCFGHIWATNNEESETAAEFYLPEAKHLMRVE
jgi:hypothetical protein